MLTVLFCWQALNAMLLACAGIASNEAVESLLHVMHLGAVPDTWAPDGSSVRSCAIRFSNLPFLLRIFTNTACGCGPPHSAMPVHPSRP